MEQQMETSNNEAHKSLLGKLDAKIPRDVISKRDAGRGVKLDYLEGWYVISRLNEVLGQGNWSYGAVDMNLVHTGTVDSDRGKRFVVHYTSKVRLVVELPTNGKICEFIEFGYGDGMDSTNIGKAHELAVKEAVTDGLKRCAKNLGMSFGLALYDKSQEFVEEALPTTKHQGSFSVVDGGATGSVPVAKNPETKNTKEAMVSKVKLFSSILANKKLITIDSLVETLKTKYAVSSVANLSDTQLNEFYTYLQSLDKN